MVGFVKKALPYIVMAAAVYFTAGIALSAFPATAGFAASLPGFAGGGFAGLGFGAGATAGTGIFTQVASSIGLGTLGSSGGLVGGALAAGTSEAALVAGGINAAAVTTGAAEFGTTAAGAAAGAAGAGGAAAGGAGVATGGAGATAGAAGAGAGAGTGAVAKAGMTIGEKILLASTGTQALGALMTPKQADTSKFHGAFYGMDRKGKGGAVDPGKVEGAQGSTAVSGVAAPVAMPEQGKPVAGQQPPPGTQTANTGELFAQGSQLATATPKRAGSKFDIGQPQDLFQPMRDVRYVQ